MIKPIKDQLAPYSTLTTIYEKFIYLQQEHFDSIPSLKQFGFCKGYFKERQPALFQLNEDYVLTTKMFKIYKRN